MHKQKFLTISITTLLLLALIGQVYALGTAPPMGSAVTFAVLGSTTVTNTGNSLLYGDLGLSPGTAVTGFPPGIVVPPGSMYITDAVALGARNDATAAYVNLGGQACDFNYAAPTDLSGMNLVPGVYCFSSSVANTGVLTLNGIATDVWIFKSGSSLTAGPGSSVIGTGSECNIFWQVGSSATLDTTAVFKGTIIANQSISMNNGATLNGRALALNGAVTLINNIIDNSVCSGLVFGGVGVTKIFSPPTILQGNVSTLTITFTNAEPGIATLGGDFTDTLPLGVVVAAAPNLATTCGGIPSIGVGGDSVTLPTGSTIPAAVGGIPSYCTLSVDVTASTVGIFTNTVAAGELTTDEGDNASATSAVLTTRSIPAPGPTNNSGSGLPVFPDTGSGAPIFNDIFPRSWVLFGGFFSMVLVFGVLALHRVNKPKQ